jgi:hypothetical protein
MWRRYAVRHHVLCHYCSASAPETNFAVQCTAREISCFHPLVLRPLPLRTQHSATLGLFLFCPPSLSRSTLLAYPLRPRNALTIELSLLLEALSGSLNFLIVSGATIPRLANLHRSTIFMPFLHRNEIIFMEILIERFFNADLSMFPFAGPNNSIIFFHVFCSPAILF